MKIAVVSPHPDDETLGCGGAIFRHIYDGDQVFWIIVTSINENYGFTCEAVKRRETEINKVKDRYGFTEVFQFEYPPSRLDEYPLVELIGKIGNVYSEVKPEIIYIPFIGDVHTDHQIIAKAFQSTCKWFRYPSVKRVLMYETQSETEFSFIEERSFRPTVFFNISQ